MGRLLTVFLLLMILFSCAGKPTIHLNRTPDALCETLEHSRAISEEEHYYQNEDRCYKLFSNNQWAYEDCLAKRAPASKRDFRYEQKDPIIVLPEFKQQNLKNVNIR